MDDRHFSNFQIAGFTYYDGAEVFELFKIGSVLELRAEPDNRFDPYAVAIYISGAKAGLYSSRKK
jgi:hypothetical protein